MRTLVVSDLHLGGRLRRDVLRRAQALDLLLGAIDGVERLVLLGDVVELLEGRPHQALEAAEPVLRALGTRLGRAREVILVPGNHDAPLVRPWLSRNGALLTADTAIPLDATAPLARVASWLGPARVRVHYPGVWLRADVWATHGHYLERHLLPEAAYGIARGRFGRLPRDGVTPLDYEYARGPSLSRLGARLTSWLKPRGAALADDLLELLRAATMPGAPRLGHRVAPLVTTLLGVQMRRASIPALAQVARRLQVDADWVIFGHVHRCGPLAGDDQKEWQGAGGRPRIANAGSWVYEPALLHRARPPHPYWPGGGVLLESSRAPRAITLLDGLDAASLRPPPVR